MFPCIEFRYLSFILRSVYISYRTRFSFHLLALPYLILHWYILIEKFRDIEYRNGSRFFSFSVRYRVELSFNSHDTSYQVYMYNTSAHTMYMLNSSCTWRVAHTAGGGRPPRRVAGGHSLRYNALQNTSNWHFCRLRLENQSKSCVIMLPKTLQIDIFANYV